MRLLTIALNDLRLLFMDRSTWINVFGISVLLVIVVGFATGGIGGGSGTPTVRVDVLDRDESTLSAEFVDALREANDTLLLCPMDNTNEDPCRLSGEALTEELAAERLREQISLGLVVVPEGFGEALEAGDDVALIYRSNPEASAPMFIQQAVQTATDEVSGVFKAVQTGRLLVEEADLSIDEETFADAVEQNARATWAGDPIRLAVTQANQPTDDGPSDATQSGFGQSVPGMGTMYVMFIIFPAMAAFIQERQQWTLQRLIVSPASKADVIGGKMLARIVLGMIQYGVAFAVGAIIGVEFGSSPVALVLVMLAFVTCIAGLTLAISTVIESEQQASAVALLLAMTLAPLGGAWWPIEIVPPFMQTIALATPVGWVMRAYTELIFFSGGLGDVLLPVGILFGAAALFFAVGVARFRYD